MKRDLNAVARRTEPIQTFLQVRNFYGCSCPDARYRAPPEKELREIVERAGFSINGLISIQPGSEHHGVVCIVPLLESHVVIDGWPERGNALQIVLHFCNFSRDNHDKARLLFTLLREYFSPGYVAEPTLELCAPV